MALRVLLAPITVSPTKPLTPSHVKFLLAVDVLRRATGVISDVDCVYNHRTWAVTQQTLAFWEYLDRAHPGTDFTSMSEEDIGTLYVHSSHEVTPPPFRDDAMAEYASRVERSGWLHPASERVLDIWEDHYRVLGLIDPAMGRHGPPILSTAEVLESLASKGLCVDARRFGGAVYLDATSRGMPLRMIVSPSGQANYLMCLLRELIPLVPRYDRIVLAYDRDLWVDYLLIEQVLRAYDANVSRFEVVRVPVNGVVMSGRRGGWLGYTVPDLRSHAANVSDAAFQLGMRLYLIAVLGQGGRDSIRSEGVRRWAGRATRLIERHRAQGDVACPTLLQHLARRQGYVDPYRWMSMLLRRRGDIPLPEAIDILGCAERLQ